MCTALSEGLCRITSDVVSITLPHVKMFMFFSFSFPSGEGVGEILFREDVFLDIYEFFQSVVFVNVKFITHAQHLCCLDDHRLRARPDIFFLHVDVVFVIVIVIVY